MKYYKNMDSDYIQCLSTGTGQTEITETEYERILSVLKSKPTDTDGYYYRLTNDLQWEKQPRAQIAVNDELSTEDAIKIITGGVV